MCVDMLSLSVSTDVQKGCSRLDCKVYVCNTLYNSDCLHKHHDLYAKSCHLLGTVTEIRTALRILVARLVDLLIFSIRTHWLLICTDID